MSPEDYRRASDLFDRLRDLPDGERAVALESACTGNAELRAQVVRLLDADREASSGSFLERRAIEDAARLLISETPELPAPGTVIGNYRLGPRIGAGGMGIVFEGQDLRLQRLVAIKLLPLPGTAEREERIQRFQREARAVSLLNHPNIVSIFDANFDRGHYYIAMEFVEGRTLRQVIASESPGIDAKTILNLIDQTASALSAAHEAGIVHRDIKPENIMVRPDGFVKVLDFGLAKLVGPSSNPQNGPPDLRSRPGNLAGTVQYLSPEQVVGKPVSPRSDMFSLGVVAYELATGIRPFDGPTDGAIFDAILNRIPAPPSTICPSLGGELDNLILQALEKDPELRFQTASDLRSACRRLTRDYLVKSIEKDRDSEPRRALPAPSAAGTAAQPARSRWARPLLALASLAALGAAFFWLTRPMPPPRVTRIQQITTDGQTKQRLVNDGTRLYYAAGPRDSDMKMFQVSLKGGDPIPMPRLTGMLPLDISPDRSEMLLGQILKGPLNQGTIDGPFPIWVADTLGNSPRRLGDLSAQEVRWSPTGDRILYSNGPELRIARADGAESRTVATMKGLVHYPQWSPDGLSIRFTLATEKSHMLWEVAPDGTHPHPLFPEWADHEPVSGAWTPDGKYFVFAAGPGGARDLWAVRQTRRLLETAPPVPVRLTTGPMKADLPEASADGRRIFFLGTLNSAELVRYDRKPDQWTPYLGGLAAMQLDFSRDGKWVAYARCPEGTIWRMALDGSDRLQLTASPLHALNPRWSPDGTEITFFGGPPGEPHRLYVVPAAGGAVRQLTYGQTGSSGDDDGSWSPDGASLAFGAKFGDPSVDARQRLALEIVDVKSQRVTKLPGSQGLWSPRWSPDGRYIAAMGFPNRIWLYDVETRACKQLTAIGAGWPSWSRDSQYIYFQNNPGRNLYRVSIEDGHLEQVASLSRLKMSIPGLGWVGLTPDGSLISTRDAGGVEIYALDWETP
jgi:serine/threonine protein kinase/Tol biopolymer transport system component